jgi:hypothetical protein
MARVDRRLAATRASLDSIELITPGMDLRGRGTKIRERSGQVILQVLFGELAKFIGNGPGYSQHD